MVERRGHELQTEGNILGEKSLEQFLEGIVQLFTLAPRLSQAWISARQST